MAPLDRNDLIKSMIVALFEKKLYKKNIKRWQDYIIISTALNSSCPIINWLVIFLSWINSKN